MTASPPAAASGEAGAGRTLIIACGALARELRAVIAASRLDAIDIRCLPATLHNRPALIPERVREAIRRWRPHYARLLVLYGDCGTGGELDRVLAEEGVSRIDGPHCYAFYAGDGIFDALAEAEPGTFYLTDFLARQFETLVWRGLGLDRHPELLALYFENYRRLIWLAQTDDPLVEAKAREAAARLGLAFERHDTGLGQIERFLRQVA